MSFGGFLADVPRHLGVNEALDAATDAFVAPAYSFRSGRRGPEELALRRHAKAINVLRTCLDSQSAAHASETLCAIQLIMIYQVGVKSFRHIDTVLNHYSLSCVLRYG